MSNNTCMFINDDPHVAAFFNDMEITEDVELPPGTIIVSRYVLMYQTLKKKEFNKKE